MDVGGARGAFHSKKDEHLRIKSSQVSLTFFPHLQVIDPQKSPSSPPTFTHPNRNRKTKLMFTLLHSISSKRKAMDIGGTRGTFHAKKEEHLSIKSSQVSLTFFPHLRVIDPQRSPKSPPSSIVINTSIHSHQRIDIHSHQHIQHP